MRLAFTLFCFVSAASTYAAEPAPLLKVNQSGYLNQGQKLAVIPGKSQHTFQLVALPSGQIVFRGQSSEAQLWAPAGETVSIADFSQVQTNGRYRLEVAGYAPVELQIAAQPYAQLHDAAIKAYYFNRASQQLEPAYAGVWARPAGHPDNQIKIHASAASASRAPAHRRAAARACGSCCRPAPGRQWCQDYAQRQFCPCRECALLHWSHLLCKRLRWAAMRPLSAPAKPLPPPAMRVAQYR